jgi:hypothetical protein
MKNRIPEHIRKGIQQDLRNDQFNKIMERGNIIEEKRNEEAAQKSIHENVYGNQTERNQLKKTSQKSKVRFSVLLQECDVSNFNHQLGNNEIESAKLRNVRYEFYDQGGET